MGETSAGPADRKKLAQIVYGSTGPALTSK
jgi:hypothetical protein